MSGKRLKNRSVGNASTHGEPEFWRAASIRLANVRRHGKCMKVRELFVHHDTQDGNVVADTLPRTCWGFRVPGITVLTASKSRHQRNAHAAMLTPTGTSALRWSAHGKLLLGWFGKRDREVASPVAEPVAEPVAKP